MEGAFRMMARSHSSLLSKMRRILPRWKRIWLSFDKDGKCFSKYSYTSRRKKRQTLNTLRYSAMDSAEPNELRWRVVALLKPSSFRMEQHSRITSTS